MSSSAASSTSGGKYTRDLKLRVLEHYFRNGGDVFGNKQSTAKKFGVDSKTINRFLKIHELVRVARKNAKSSKTSGASGGGFKEPLLPSGPSRPRPPVKQTVRITLPEEPDEAVINQSADGNLSSIGKLLKIFELGTQEIRELLLAECDLIYECRVCRGLFRSVANLLSHKRRYCTRPHADTRQVFGCGPGQSLAAPSDGVLVLPLPAAVDRLPEVRQAEACAARAAAAQPVPTVRLEELPGSQVAVFQTVGDAPSVGDSVREVRRLEAAAGRTVRLGRDGRVVESDEEEPDEPEPADGGDGRHVCQHCNTTFSTRKTLSHHVRSLHASTRIYYPCSLCSAAFINMFSVERHLQKVHKKKQDEIDVLKEGIKQKSFHRSVTEPQSVVAAGDPNVPMKVTSYEWKCRQCNRRFLSLPVGLQHVQSAHPQFATARAGLVRVCRVLRQPADSGAVSTRSSSGAVTPADAERAPAADDDADEPEPAGDRMLFNKANLLKRLAAGGERCVLCRKVFTGHLQACGHLRLHDQSEIEAYLGQKVRLIRRRRPADAEEYELDEPAPAAADSADDDAESDGAATPPPEPAASVESRGFPVQLVPAGRVRRRDFIHVAADGDSVCTLCEARFERWSAARAHMACHSPGEVDRYVARHAVDGLVGVPAAPLGRRAPADDDDGDDDDASVDTDIEAGAKLLVSCKLWSPKKKRGAESDGEERPSDDDEAEDAEEEDADEDEDNENDEDNEPLAMELDGETVDKWEAIRRKGERLRCVVCNKTFMKNGYAETHLRTEHTFEEIRDFVNNWRFKGIRVPPRSGEAEPMEDDDENDSSSDEDGPAEPTAESAGPAAAAAAKQPRSPPPQKGVKRPAEAAAAPAAPAKAPRRDPPAVAALKAPAGLGPGVGPIGPNTKILKISRSDLLMRKDNSLCLCLVCDREFDTHAAACIHMRQHSDQDIRNFIKTRGREFLPAFEQKSKTYLPALVRTNSTPAGPAAAPPAAAEPPAAPAASAAPAGDKSAELDSVDKPSSVGPASADSPAVPQESSDGETSGAEDGSPHGFRRDEVVRELELFDKAQLLKRQKDGTKCLLCTRVFSKHSSACGHLSHHGSAEVQAWRDRMRSKAAALLKMARRPVAAAGGSPRPAKPAASPTKTAASPAEAAASPVPEKATKTAGSPAPAPAKEEATEGPDAPKPVKAAESPAPAKSTRAAGADEKSEKQLNEDATKSVEAAESGAAQPAKTESETAPSAKAAETAPAASGGDAAGSPPAVARPAPFVRIGHTAVKLAVLQAGDVPLAAGRTIMRLPPGVKLPLPAGALPRVLRPIAPKVAAQAAPAPAPTPAPASAPAAGLQPALAGAGGSPRPRPPPLLRAPLLQTLSAAGRVTIQIPATKAAAASPGALLATVVPGAPRPAARAAISQGSEPAADAERAEKKAEAERKETSAQRLGQRENAPQNKQAAGRDEPDGEAAVKSEPGKPAADASKPAKRLGDVKSGAAKSPQGAEKRADPGTAARNYQRRAPPVLAERPADRRPETRPDAKRSPAGAEKPMAAARTPVVTKRAFIPEVARPLTRCWTPDPNSRGSPRSPAAAAAEPAAPAPAPGEVPQTRARAEAAMAARVRQTRRSGSAGAAERK